MKKKILYIFSFLIATTLIGAFIFFPPNSTSLPQPTNTPTKVIQNELSEEQKSQLKRAYLEGFYKSHDSTNVSEILRLNQLNRYQNYLQKGSSKLSQKRGLS